MSLPLHHADVLHPNLKQKRPKSTSSTKLYASKSCWLKPFSSVHRRKSSGLYLGAEAAECACRSPQQRGKAHQERPAQLIGADLLVHPTPESHAKCFKGSALFQGRPLPGRNTMATPSEALTCRPLEETNSIIISLEFYNLIHLIRMMFHRSHTSQDSLCRKHCQRPSTPEPQSSRRLALPHLCNMNQHGVFSLIVVKSCSICVYTIVYTSF